MPDQIREPIRPRRSVLYVPASNDRGIDKARTAPCDAVILDLEDAVAPEFKAAARDQACAALRQRDFGRRERVLRINALNTEWGAADLVAAGRSGADAILVPKIRAAADILTYERALADAPASLQLWAMIETPHAILRLDEIAATSSASRLRCLVMGTNDLARDLRLKVDVQRRSLVPLLSLSVVAARAHEIGILDGVYNTLDDIDGFTAQCRQGLECGFDGKTLIHPRQIDPCNAVFSPAPQDVEWARNVRDAFASPQNAGKGALRLDGAMVERLHLAQAQYILALVATLAATRDS
jgi:citrate lyase subunit beta/citryl-CoA lyase